jgi:hypothetical protein
LGRLDVVPVRFGVAAGDATNDPEGVGFVTEVAAMMVCLAALNSTCLRMRPDFELAMASMVFIAGGR